MARQMNNCASREQNQACLNSSETKSILERKFKDSGMEWVGKIPSNWSECRLKDLGYLYGGLTGKSGEDFNVEDNDNFAWFIPFTNIFNNNIIQIDNLRKVKVIEGEKQNEVHKGDVLFLMSSEDFDGIGKNALMNDEIPQLYLNSFCKGFRITHQNVVPNYLNYLLSSQVIREQIRIEAKGFIRINLRQDKLACISILFPPFPEQQAIANFLDKKCGEIDELVSVEEAIIESLKTYKQSVITETVTRGLNPNVKLKDSGVEWIGEIPEHWEICKIKNIFFLSTGTTPKGFDTINEDEEVVNWYTPSDIIDGGNELWDSQRKLSKIVIENERIKMYPTYSLIYVGIGATAGKVGYSHEEGYSNQQITALIPKGKGDKYYYYFLNVMNKIIRENAYFTTLPIINNSYLGQTYISFPPIVEQSLIVDYLDKKCSDIDALVALHQEKIETLKTYKQSMIFEYVTGKKEVV